MSEFLKRLTDRARGFQWDPEPEDAPPADKETAVHADSFDQFAWDMLNATVPSIDRTIKNVAREYDYVPPAYEDLFNLLYQGDPLFRDAREMKEGYAANHSMLKQLSDTDEFDRLRGDTVLDEYGTAFAMLSMENQMKEAFARVKEARERQQQAQQQAQQAQGGLQQAIDGAQQPGADPAQAGQALQEAMQQAQQAQETLDQANATQEQAAGQGAEALQRAAKDTKDDLDEQNKTASSYGLGPGQLERMSFDERRALTAKLNQGKLARLAKLIGAFRQFGDAERRRKVKHAPSQVFDVELGNDVTKLVSEEFNQLAVPELEDMFWLRYVQHGLMQWEERGPQNLGQGPIIVVCDESGSMGMRALDGDGNTAEAWSKAISMALCDQAKRGKRDFTYIGFASDDPRRGLHQQWRIDFPNGDAPIDKVIEFVTHFFQGGTHYERPLTMAMDLIKEYADNGRPKPDIVFITDDDCRVAEEFIDKWQKVKEDADVTVYGIQIGGSGYQTAMKQLCDKTIQLTALNSNPEGMTELFRTI